MSIYKIVLPFTLLILYSCQKEPSTTLNLSTQVVGNYLVTDTESFIHPVTQQLVTNQQQYGTHIYAVNDTLVCFVNFYPNNEAVVLEHVIQLPFLTNSPAPRPDTLFFYRNTANELSYTYNYDETKVIGNAAYSVQVTLEGVLERK